MLFASVDGISKCGYFDGDGSNPRTITVGFQPRLLIIKGITGSNQYWNIFDTTRGWASGNDSWMKLDLTSAAGSHNFGEPTSTGFTLSDDNQVNANNEKYIYYAHA